MKVKLFSMFAILFLLMSAVGTLAQVTPVFAAPGDTTRVSVDSSGAEANNPSNAPSISADGRYVAFRSNASNLVSGDTNSAPDIFLRDTLMNTTTRVSVASDGTEANGSSSGAAISADGRYMAFTSNATNLVSGDTNGWEDVFVRDIQTNTTMRVSVASDGAEGNNPSYGVSISADGRYVVFASDATNLVSGDAGWTDVFVRDTILNTTEIVSLDSSGVKGNNDSYNVSISANGRYVAFQSDASNLVSGDTNGATDVFLRDRVANTTTRISVNSTGAEGNAQSGGPVITPDGRYVAFSSLATNLVSGDTNGAWDVFVRDTAANTTTRISVDSSGAEGNGASYLPSISADGRYVAFVSDASNLVSSDTNGFGDIFVRDTVANTTARVSVAAGGAEGNGHSSSASISADGRFVAFDSGASNLVAGDTNGYYDIFVHETNAPAVVLLFTPVSGSSLFNKRPAFDWFDYPDAALYQVQISTFSDFSSKVTKATVKTPFTSYTPKKNLLPNTLYYWRVRAKVGKTYSAWSQTWSFTTGNPPSVPILVAPGNNKVVAGPSPLFDWKDVTAPVGVTLDHYEIQISADANFSTFQIGTPTDSQYTGFLLKPGTYYWRVRSVADTGDYSAWSKVRSVIIH